MDYVDLLITYRYWFIAVGVVIADIPTLLLVGYFITRDQLEFVPALAVAASSRYAFDLALFYLGRKQRRLGDRSSYLRRVKNKLKSFTRRHQDSIVFTFHFLQGMKLGTPIVLGMSSTRLQHFATLNIAAVALWAGVIISLGFVFGAALI